MAPPSKKQISHNRHLSLQSLVSMSTLMAPTHRIVPVTGSGPTSPRATTPDTAPYFALSHTIQTQLRRIFDEVRGADEVLSKDKLVAFLKNTQRQEIELPEGADKGFTYEQWLAFLWMKGGLEGVRPREKGRMDLSRPISNYYISSSHNTYLDGNQWFSKSNTDAYRFVLTKGCRCIEIDVHNGESVSFVAPTLPSELRASAKIKKDNLMTEYKSKWGDFKSFVREKTSSFSEKDKKDKKDHTSTGLSTKGDNGNGNGHKRNVSNVPSISRERSSDSEDTSDDAKESAVELSGEATGELASKKSSRHSSKSSTSAPTILRKVEPIVLHGWTVTRPVGFRDVCKAVAETAFVTTNLPLIVSLEVACDLDQQEVMVQIMKEEWADYLIDTAHPLCDPNERLPRLDELLGKILVKVKKTAEQPPLSPTSTGNLSPLPSPSPSSATFNRASTLTPTSTFTLSTTSTNATLTPTSSNDRIDRLSSTETDASLSTSKTATPRSRSPTPKPKIRIAPSLSALGVYTHSTHFTSFTHATATTPPHIYSLSEGDILDLYATSPSAVLSHNRNYFMRAYPAGRRVDSSNPDPSMFWRKGVQMVALNWQVWDEGTMVNEAMFGDEEGWVLKPCGYRSEDAESAGKADAADPGVAADENDAAPTLKPIARASALNGDLPSALAVPRPIVRKAGKTLDLTLRIFAAQHIPLPKRGDEDIRPRLKVEMHAERGGDKAGDDWKRQTETKRGTSPDWEEEELRFWGAGPGVVEELSFVRFKIEDDGFMDTLAAWACVRLDRLQNGYRFIKLLDSKGKPTEGLLFVHVERVER